MISFGENLKRIRTDKKLSQGDLAKKVGMHATHISRYERDLTSPAIDALKKLAEQLEVSVDVLVYGPENTRAEQNLSDQELLSLFKKVQALEENDLNCVKSLLQAYVFKSDMQARLAS